MWRWLGRRAAAAVGGRTPAPPPPAIPPGSPPVPLCAPPPRDAIPAVAEAAAGRRPAVPPPGVCHRPVSALLASLPGPPLPPAWQAAARSAAKREPPLLARMRSSAPAVAETALAGVPAATEYIPPPTEAPGESPLPTSVSGRPLPQGVGLGNADAFYATLKAAGAAAANVGRSPQSVQQERDKVDALLRHFSSRGWAEDQALALYVNAQLFPKAAAAFRDFVQAGLTPGLFETAVRHAGAPRQATDALLFPLFARFLLDTFMADLAAYRTLVRSADMRLPHEWYALARSVRRKIVYHSGPTNSGKTHSAVTAMASAASGVYAGPLRLLAMEVYDSLNAAGTQCNLLTGQEARVLPDAKHTACTVEMVPIHTPVDVCVLDEVQLLADESRGWAWARALHGVPAKEVHVCGDGTALPLVRAAARLMGEELEEKTYTRFKPLVAESRSLGGDLGLIRPGDCLVAFSRREIFALKRAVERLPTAAGDPPRRCCVIYGALPPETRRQQARLYNDADSGYNVLVASDAIGMGLNLNIRRVVFHSLVKFSGELKGPVTPSAIKQIAGRAGRRSSPHAQGLVTTLHEADMARLRKALETDLPPATAMGLFPAFEQFELFASQMPGVPFPALLEKFEAVSKLDPAHFFCKQESLRKMAETLEAVPTLSLRDRFTFTQAPVSIRESKVLAAALRYAQGYAAGGPVPPGLPPVPPPPLKDGQLAELEVSHQVAALYQWLNLRFPHHFPESESAAAAASAITDALGSALAAPQRPLRPDKSRRVVAEATGADPADGTARRGRGRPRLDHSTPTHSAPTHSTPAQSTPHPHPTPHAPVVPPSAAPSPQTPASDSARVNLATAATWRTALAAAISPPPRPPQPAPDVSLSFFGRIFSSGASLKAHLSRLLATSPLDTPLSGEDRDSIVALVAAGHAAAAEKIGPGVTDVVVAVFLREGGPRATDFSPKTTDFSPKDSDSSPGDMGPRNAHRRFVMLRADGSRVSVGYSAVVNAVAARGGGPGTRVHAPLTRVSESVTRVSESVVAGTAAGAAATPRFGARRDPGTRVHDTSLTRVHDKSPLTRVPEPETRVSEPGARLPDHPPLRRDIALPTPTPSPPTPTPITPTPATGLTPADAAALAAGLASLTTGLAQLSASAASLAAILTGRADATAPVTATVAATAAVVAGAGQSSTAPDEAYDDVMAVRGGGRLRQKFAAVGKEAGPFSGEPSPQLWGRRPAGAIAGGMAGAAMVAEALSGLLPLGRKTGDGGASGGERPGMDRAPRASQGLESLTRESLTRESVIRESGTRESGTRVRETLGVAAGAAVRRLLARPSRPAGADWRQLMQAPVWGGGEAVAVAVPEPGTSESGIPESGISESVVESEAPAEASPARPPRRRGMNLC